MINLLTKDLPTHYRIGRNISVPHIDTTNIEFDLDDNPDYIVPFRTGNISLKNTLKKSIQVVNYEGYINQFAGTAFEQGRKRCDYLLYDTDRREESSFFILNEQTSTLDSISNLSLPILKKGEVLFAGGKYEKAEIQLYESLSALKNVSSIASFIESSDRKICLMSYVIIPRSVDNNISASRAFNRYRAIESAETGEDGAIIENYGINQLGFELRRISHDYTFVLN